MGEQHKLMARIEPIACPLAVAAAAFLLSALQSLLPHPTPDLVPSGLLGLAFVAGFFLRWRAAAPVAAGTAGWLLVGGQLGDWPVVLVAAAGTAVGWLVAAACSAARPRKDQPEDEPRRQRAELTGAGARWA